MDLKFIIDSGCTLTMNEFDSAYLSFIECRVWQSLMPYSTIKSSRSPDWNLKMEDIMYDDGNLRRFIQLLSNRTGKRIELFDRRSLSRKDKELLDYTGAFNTDGGTIVIMIRK